MGRVGWARFQVRGGASGCPSHFLLVPILVMRPQSRSRKVTSRSWEGKGGFSSSCRSFCCTRPIWKHASRFPDTTVSAVLCCVRMTGQRQARQAAMASAIAPVSSPCGAPSDFVLRGPLRPVIRPQFGSAHPRERPPLLRRSFKRFVFFGLKCINIRNDIDAYITTVMCKVRWPGPGSTTRWPKLHPSPRLTRRPTGRIIYAAH
jgi:hypothetical protein